MDIISVNNNDSSSHFESDGVVTRAPSMGEEDRNDGVAKKFDDRNATSNGVGEGERIRRKRKTRRFKSRYKNKSSSSSSMSKNAKYLKKMRRSRSYPQSEAPNNTNEFLMADHDNIENLDEKIVVPEFARDGSRARESSFTSVDTDEYYSSPDNDEDDEYFTKDFDNTYQSVCAEKLVGLAKPQLAKIILDLESKVDELSKQINHRSNNSNQMSDIIKQVNGIENKELSAEIKDIIRENERLRSENEALQRFIKENAVTWSSSSSSSSSDDSDSDSSDSTDADAETDNNQTTANSDNQSQRIPATANGADDNPA